MIFVLKTRKPPKLLQFNSLPSRDNRAGFILGAMFWKIVPLLMIGVLAAPPLAVAQTSVKAADDSVGFPIIDELKSKDLLLPVPGVEPKMLKDTFRQKRGAQRVHHALDIVVPRNTPILSTDSGTIIKLFTSKAGGLTIYAADSERRFIYYYAHLESYRTGIHEGMKLARGDTIGYVGTSGNAPANYPHLHFAILRSYNVARWSRGIPVNPAKVF